MTKHTFSVLAICLIAVALLVGCKEGSSVSGIDTADGSFIALGGNAGGGVGDVGDGGPHLPEPTTMALLGSGLLAYALYRQKRNKK